MLRSALLLLIAATVPPEPPPQATAPVPPPKGVATAHVRRVGEWLGSPPLLLDKLEGKVMLVHSTMPTSGCPLDGSVTPALNTLGDDFKTKGLVVVALYQSDVVNPSDLQEIKRCVRRLQPHFALLTGTHRGDFGRWAIGDRPTDLASVTFLVDKRGTIRRVAPGESLALGTKEYDGMKATIEKVLAE